MGRSHANFSNLQRLDASLVKSFFPLCLTFPSPSAVFLFPTQGSAPPVLWHRGRWASLCPGGGGAGPCLSGSGPGGCHILPGERRAQGSGAVCLCLLAD